jgi:hypothetical protein
MAKGNIMKTRVSKIGNVLRKNLTCRSTFGGQKRKGREKEKGMRRVKEERNEKSKRREKS